MTRRTENPTALDAFLARKAEIDFLLERLTAISANHFEVSPDAVNWGHVGTLGHYAEQLKRITDAAYNEGEYAEKAPIDRTPMARTTRLHDFLMADFAAHFGAKLDRLGAVRGEREAALRSTAAVHDGFTLAELDYAFDLVAPRPNWKATIDATFTVPEPFAELGYVTRLISAATVFYAGCHARVAMTAPRRSGAKAGAPARFTAKAAGYYATIGA